MRLKEDSFHSSDHCARRAASEEDPRAGGPHRDPFFLATTTITLASRPDPPPEPAPDLASPHAAAPNPRSSSCSSSSFWDGAEEKECLFPSLWALRPILTTHGTSILATSPRLSHLPIRASALDKCKRSVKTFLSSC